MLNITSFLLCAGFIRVTQGEGADFLSKRDDDYSPTYLWSLDSGHHGDNGNKHALYGVLRNASLTSGPDFSGFGNFSTSSAVQFLGDPWSFMQIANINGTLDPSLVFTWSMLLQPDDPSSGSGVIMEYSTYNGGGFFRVRQAGKDLQVDAVDTGGQQLSLVASNLFQDYTWPFVCVTFISVFKHPMLKVVYDEFNVLKPGKKEEQEVTNGTILLGEGDVRFGASFDPALPAFAGKLSCLRFHDKFVVKFHDDPSYLLDCHPGGTSPDLSERTIDYEDMTAVTTAPIFTTAAATASEAAFQSATAAGSAPAALLSPTDASGTSTSSDTSAETLSLPASATSSAPPATTDQSATSAPSVTTDPSATPAPSATTDPSATSSAPLATTDPSATSALSATTDPPATSAPSATTDPSATSVSSATVASIVTASSLAAQAPDICDCCIYLTQHPGYGNVVSVSGLALEQLVVANLGACSRSCALTAGCVSIALETQVRDAHVPGNCFLLGGIVNTVSAGSLYVYQMV